jgi:hypothetical protein
MASDPRYAEPKIRKNRWIGFLVAGGIVTPNGVSLLAAGIFFLLIMSPIPYFAAFMVVITWGLIIGGGVMTFVGAALLKHGYDLYQFEKEWDRRHGLA